MRCKHVAFRYYRVMILKDGDLDGREAWESALKAFAKENCEVRIEEIKEPEKVEIIKPHP